MRKRAYASVVGVVVGMEVDMVVGVVVKDGQPCCLPAVMEPRQLEVDEADLIDSLAAGGEEHIVLEKVRRRLGRATHDVGGLQVAVPVHHRQLQHVAPLAHPRHFGAYSVERDGRG